MLEPLKQEVLDANLALVRAGLVLMTFGNASAIDRVAGRIAIKPSGVAYDQMSVDDIVIVDLEGTPVEGKLAPSVDTPIHLALYERFPEVGGIVHTHSHFATCWAQACRPIPCLGTTHADYFHGEIPVSELLSEEEAAAEYERCIGDGIARCFESRSPLNCPAALAANHGPFVWGETVAKAVENAIVLEEVAKIAYHTMALDPPRAFIGKHLLDRHFFRKHGGEAYYGQR